MNTKRAFSRVIRSALCFLPAFLLILQTPVFADAEKPAVDPVSQSESYTAVLYDNTNGLPTSEANDIAQTGDLTMLCLEYFGSKES